MTSDAFYVILCFYLRANEVLVGFNFACSRRQTLDSVQCFFHLHLNLHAIAFNFTKQAERLFFFVIFVRVNNGFDPGINANR